MEKSVYEARRAALIAEITAAFDGVGREDGITLHQARAIDWCARPEEIAEAIAQDNEKRWQDMPDEDIRWHTDIFIWLDFKGFRYYLPAYVIWYLKHVDDDAPFMGSATGEEVEFMLIDAVLNKHPFKKWHFEKLKALSPVQSKAIAHFVLFIAERDEIRWQEVVRRHGLIRSEENQAQLALDHYWSQFL